MKIQQFNITLLSVFIIFSIGYLEVAKADSDLKEVWPTGDFPADWRSVSNALSSVAAGGTVLLHARDTNGVKKAFDFGVAPLQINKSVVITGDNDGDQWTGADMTKIENGFLTFCIAVTKGNVQIRKIHFHNGTGAMILAVKCSGLTISENRVTADSMEGRTIAPPPGYKNLAWGIAAWNTDLNHPENIAGKLIIIHNYVNLEQNAADIVPPAAPHHANEAEEYNKKTYSSFGISVWNTVAEIEIRGNRVIDDASRGIFLKDNYHTVIVEDNMVMLNSRRSYHKEEKALGDYPEVFKGISARQGKK
jgi:hypothetical protein